MEKKVRNRLIYTSMVIFGILLGLGFSWFNSYVHRIIG